MDKGIRIDKYLWAIRLFKTRSLATKACDDGKVKLKDGASCKPSKSVKIGECYDIRNEGKKNTIEVLGLLEKRVNYETAILHYKDITSEEDQLHNIKLGTSFYTGKRLIKTGRPSKKERRDLNDFTDWNIEFD